MLNKSTLMRIAIIAVALHPTLFGQPAVVGPTDAIIASFTTDPASGATSSTLVMIENRARVLGARVSGSETRYWELKDSDLVGKTPAQLLQRLSPTSVVAGDGVRQMEVVVDLEHPVTISTNSPKPVNIGTTVVQGPVKTLEVHANIIASAVTVVNK